MSNQQPHTYQFPSSRNHGISKDSPKANRDKTSTIVLETPSERTPLIIKGTDEHTRTQGGETASERLKILQGSDNQSSESAQGPTIPVLGSRTAVSSCSYNGLSTSDVSLSLVNSGSVARDHLASERTFLAYVRTSLAIASAGVALAQILTIAELYADATSSRHIPKDEQQAATWARPLGAVAVIISMLVLFIGVGRYFSIQKALVGGQFPVSCIGVSFMSILFGALIIATFGVLFHNGLSTLW